MGYARTIHIRRLASFLLLLLLAVAHARAGVTRGVGLEKDGARVFLTFCAGCHGTDGFAAYPAAPSFSMGDRLGKDDAALLQSVLAGIGAMPAWQDKLSVPELRSAIQYLRVMDERFRLGQSPRQQALPRYMYRFRPVGESDVDWWHHVDD